MVMMQKFFKIHTDGQVARDLLFALVLIADLFIIEFDEDVLECAGDGACLIAFDACDSIV